MRRVDHAEPFGGAVQVQLDHLGRAGPDQEQLPDIGAASQQAGHFTVQLGVGIGQTGQILFFQNRGAEPGFGKDHHAGGGLQQMRAGAAADHQEKRILHLAVQPDNAGQTAEHLALAAFAQHGGGAAADGRRGRKRGHATAPFSDSGDAPALSSRAMRNFHRNCAALTM